MTGLYVCIVNNHNCSIQKKTFGYQVNLLVSFYPFRRRISFGFILTMNVERKTFRWYLPRVSGTFILYRSHDRTYH